MNAMFESWYFATSSAIIELNRCIAAKDPEYHSVNLSSVFDVEFITNWDIHTSWNWEIEGWPVCDSPISDVSLILDWIYILLWMRVY